MESLEKKVLGGDIGAVARAITLIESVRADHRAEAESLIEMLLPRSGKAIRVGISGAPGVGKSTFIQAFGLHQIRLGHRVAVLAVDPSSRLGGGSLLADKTRMSDLARDPNAFIRPSPAGETLGGVARRTREAIIICEAAGFDVVMVETVGVGQSETAVSDMVDLFLLMLAPGGGDELQGLKKGIVELADLIVVNKADGALASDARRVVADYASAQALLQPRNSRWMPRVLPCSALNGDGIEDNWKAVLDHRVAMGDDLGEKRARQARAWLWNDIREGLNRAFESDPHMHSLIEEMERSVWRGSVTPQAAARRLLRQFLPAKAFGAGAASSTTKAPSRSTAGEGRAGGALKEELAAGTKSPGDRVRPGRTQAPGALGSKSA